MEIMQTYDLLVKIWHMTQHKEPYINTIEAKKMVGRETEKKMANVQMSRTEGVE